MSYSNIGLAFLKLLRLELVAYDVTGLKLRVGQMVWVG